MGIHSTTESFFRGFSSIPRFLFLCLVVYLSIVSATEFVYNTNFNSTNIFLYGNATFDSSSILTLTNHTPFSIGRAFYPHIIPTKHFNSSKLLSFATSFVFSITPIKRRTLTGHGFAFLFSPSRDINGTSPSEYIGFLNFTNQGDPHNHVVGIEFDVVNNEEFHDIDNNHVGFDVNSLTSLSSHEAGYWGGEYDDEFEPLKLISGETYQVWIEFMDSQLNVTMARAGTKKPRRPLINEKVNLSGVLLDEMYVGFCAATGQLVEFTRILAWSFSNSNFSIGDALVTNNLSLQKGSLPQSLSILIIVLVCLISICCVSMVLFLILWSRKGEAAEELEDWELEYWPHRICYREIKEATRGFSEENVIGIGRNGKVYKGTWQGVEVAVKRIPNETKEGMEEFLAEVSSLGRMKHRNLVGLRGWCKTHKGSLILVYDYMENGSLDKRIFECEEREMLSWKERIEVLKHIATGVLYLHEGWEVKVLHRDIKASNVLLDKDMNARLGDFGLASMHDHQGHIASTRVIGTVGYIAPEVIQAGRASTSSDVFAFGILVLEVVCGRRPIEEDKPGLVQWVMSLSEIGELHCALDERLKKQGGYSIEEVERLLHLGLICANAEPSIRPTMRQVVKILEVVIEGDDSEEEMVQENLLEKIKSAAMWSKSDTSGHRHYPTIERITRFNSNPKTSTSYSYYTIPYMDISLDGR